MVSVLKKSSSPGCIVIMSRESSPLRFYSSPKFWCR
uniref:Uncharacterized protein n=1 Tax=Anguilla anguilla TaxID=7936 RepID=A0A0E9TK50_ANGAN